MPEIKLKPAKPLTGVECKKIVYQAIEAVQEHILMFELEEAISALEELRLCLEVDSERTGVTGGSRLPKNKTK